MDFIDQTAGLPLSFNLYTLYFNILLIADQS